MKQGLKFVYWNVKMETEYDSPKLSLIKLSWALHVLIPCVLFHTVFAHKDSRSHSTYWGDQ